MDKSLANHLLRALETYQRNPQLQEKVVDTVRILTRDSSLTIEKDPAKKLELAQRLLQQKVRAEEVAVQKPPKPEKVTELETRLKSHFENPTSQDPSQQAREFDEIVKDVETKYPQEPALYISEEPIVTTPGPTQAPSPAPETPPTEAPPERPGIARVLAGKAAKGVGKEAVKKALSKLATKTGLKALGTKIGAALGSILPGIGTAIGTIVGLIGTAVVSRLGPAIKKSAKALAAVAIGLLAAGVFLGNPFLVFSGIGVGAVSTAGGGLQSLSAGAIRLGQAVMAGLVSVALPAIGIPVLIAIISVPVIVALILFIINSSAYVVPHAPGLLTTAFDNPYVKVEKTADPNEIPNPPPSREIEYTITITALRGTLTEISFDNSCEVFGDSSGEDCPSATIPSPPLIISPVEPYTFSYQISIGSQITDSIVTDMFTVTANAPEATGQSNSSSASVIVGNPPLDCLIPSNNAMTWPASQGNNLLSAILRLTSQHPAFVAKVCAGPQVNLCYDPPSVALWGRHVHRNDCDILFGSGGLTNVNNATYILAHEISHHLDRINGFWSQAYRDSGATSELPICSYTSTSELSEGFAEGNALYVQLPSFWSSRCTGTYQSLYPLHYNFARDVIF